jgi:hypothetical protein
LRCSGEAGAAASTGEDSAASSVGAEGLLKSGLKASVFSMGGIAGGAAIAGTCVVGEVVDVVVICRSHLSAS